MSHGARGRFVDTKIRQQVLLRRGQGPNYTNPPKENATYSYACHYLLDCFNMDVIPLKLHQFQLLGRGKFSLVGCVVFFFVQDLYLKIANKKTTTREIGIEIKRENTGSVHWMCSSSLPQPETWM